MEWFVLGKTLKLQDSYKASYPTNERREFLCLCWRSLVTFYNGSIHGATKDNSFPRSKVALSNET